MPKERIGNGEQFEVQVGWQADRDVQLGIELNDVRTDHPDFAALPDRRSLLWQLFGSTENLRRFGAEMVEFIIKRQPLMHEIKLAQTSDAWHQSCENLAIEIIERMHEDWRPTGVWTLLDRGECNKLIRVLRRARDSAYGRDE